MFSLLALAVRYSSHAYFEGEYQISSQKYCEISRGLIMFRIAQGTVQLATIQSLCLLALANFVGELYGSSPEYLSVLTLHSYGYASGVASY